MAGSTATYSFYTSDPADPFLGTFVAGVDANFESLDDFLDGTSIWLGRPNFAAGGAAGGFLIGSDTQFYRQAANVIRTPDSLTVDGKLSVAPQDAIDLTNAGGGFITATQAQLDIRSGAGANAVRINPQTGGTAGFEVWDGAGSPAKVFGVTGGGALTHLGTMQVGAQVISDASGNLASADGVDYGPADISSLTIRKGIITAAAA